MKHIRKFESYKTIKRREEIIKESVLQVNDIYKVRTLIDIPQSLVNAYVKKVKDTTGKNLRQFFGDVDLAEEIVKYVTLNFINVDQVPAGALTGDAQVAPDAQAQGQMAPQAQAQPGQAQAQPAQAQGQMAPQAQAQPGQAQPQVQVQTEAQPAQGGEFEEIGEEGEEGQAQGKDEDEDENEDLPL